VRRIRAPWLDERDDADVHPDDKSGDHGVGERAADEAVELIPITRSFHLLAFPPFDPTEAGRVSPRRKAL